MDLKEIIEKAKNIAESAHSSFHAGRMDDAENYLMVEMQTIARYFEAKTKPAGDVTQSASSSPDEEAQKEKQDEVPSAQARPAAIPGARAAQQYGGSLTDEKPTQ